jgi:multidrug resistance efflux pump
VNFVALRTLTRDREKLRSKLTVLCLALLTGTPLYGQSEFNATNQRATSYGASSVASQPQDPYLGGVPTGTASATPLSLSLEEAVARGLRQNLGGLLSSDAVSGAQGERYRALSALLPNLTTATSFGVRQNDLKALIGINIPGHPPVIGPFGVFDTRGYVDQTVFDWESIESARSSAAELKSAQYSYKNARELIVLVVASNYLLVFADKSQVESALAQRDTAKVLLEQTTDQKKAGLAAAVDVLRSDVELQAREQRLIVARNESAQAGPQRVASTRARALSAVADIGQKRAELEQADLNLGYTRVLAPVSGEVTKKVVVGLNVDTGEQLLTVVPLDQVWITANFKETQLRHMRAGQKVKFTCDANGRSYQGHVDSIAGATGPLFSLLPPENATGNYVKIVQRIPVKIVLDPGENRDLQLRPGMNVVAKVYVR